MIMGIWLESINESEINFHQHIQDKFSLLFVSFNLISSIQYMFYLFFLNEQILN